MPINVRNNADLDVSIPYVFSQVSISTVSASNGYSIINTSSEHFFKNFEDVGVSCLDTRFNRSESGSSGFVERINSLSFRFPNDIPSTPVSGFEAGASVPISSSVTSRRRENNLVTLQLSGVHRFADNDTISVTGLNSAWNGTFTITDAAPGGNNTRIRYSQTGPDVLSFVADSGNVSTNVFGFATNKQMLNNVANLTLFSGASRMEIGDTVTVSYPNDAWFAGTYTISNRSGSVISYSTAVSLQATLGTAIGWTKALTVNVRANNIDNITYPDLPIPISTTLSFPPTLAVGSVISVNQTGSSTWRYRTDSLSYQWLRGNSSSGPWNNISGATSSTYTLTSGDAGFFINCSVTTTNTKGSVVNLASNPQLFTAPLPAPTGLNATNRTNTTATLNWNAVANATIYEYSISTSTTFSTWTSVANNTTANITGLVHNTRYYFSVRAKRNSADVNGIEAAATEFITLVGPTTLSASIGLTNELNFGNVVLNNVVASGGGFAVSYSNYIVQYAAWNGSSWGSWVLLNTYSTISSQLIISSLSDGILYKFRSAASDAGGNPIGVFSTETSSVTPFGPPPTPSNVSVTRGANGTSLTLNWSTVLSTPGTSVVGWATSRQANPTGFADWNRFTDASLSSDLFSGLTSNTSYTLRVKAIVGTNSQVPPAPTPWDIATNFSTNIAVITQTTATTPGAPTSLTVTPGRSGSVPILTLSWTAPTNDGGSSITSYEFRYATLRSDLTSTSWTDTGSSTTSATINPIPALSLNTTYFVQVRAKNGVGAGAVDNPTSTAQSGTTWNVPGTPIINLGAFAPSFTGTGASAVVSVTLSGWSAPTSNGGTAITGYDWQINTSPSPGATWNSTAATFTGPVSLNPAARNTLYYVHVRAKNDLGAGASNSFYSARTPDRPTMNSVSATKNTGPSYTASWSATANGSNITGYEWERFRNGSLANSGTTTSTSLTFSGLSAGTHSIRVRATNALGTSPYVSSGNVTI